MDIRIKHTDKSGLQWFDPNAIYTLKEANDYIDWMEKRFGKVPFKVIVEGMITRERKDHNKPSIIYV